MITIGDYNKLRVLRKSDLGYMLTDGKEEILMHFKQADRELNDNEELEVFVYSDKEKRPTATMLKPLATINDAGFVDVVDVIPSAGVFVNINTPKDVFISKDYLPFDENLWPEVGDYLLIRLKNKLGLLNGKPLNRYEIKSLHSLAQYADYENVDGYVCRITEKGIGIVTNDLIHVFVPNSQFRGQHRLGASVTVCITKSIDGECYGKLNDKKENLIEGDKKIILAYLNEHGGMMPYTAKSSAEEIEKVFRISRKAFKRAYGGLYKDGSITFDEKKTFLVKK